MAAMGRPSIYNDELVEQICYAIANSSKGLREICKKNPHFPNPDTIYEWVRTKPNFSELYYKAKRDQITPLIDDILAISDDTSNDDIINKSGELVANNEHINRSRLRIETRKWLAARLMPKLYGDRLHIDNDNSETLKEITRVKSLVKNLKAKHE